MFSKPPQKLSHRRILIVDASRESREILRLLLEREGIETLEASGPARASQLVRDHQLHLIVYDMESDRRPFREARVDLRRMATRSDIPIVVLGTARRLAGPIPTDQFVTKPYHYAPLIRRIEGLLAG